MTVWCCLGVTATLPRRSQVLKSLCRLLGFYTHLSLHKFRSNLCKIKPFPEHLPCLGGEWGFCSVFDTLCFNLQPEQEPKEKKNNPCTWGLVAAAQAGACRSPSPRERGVWVLQTQAIGNARMPLQRSTWTWECLCELKPSSRAFWGLSVSNADIKCVSPHQSPVEAADFLLRKTRENRFSVRVVYFNVFLVFDWLIFFFFFFLEASLRGMVCFIRKWE